MEFSADTLQTVLRANVPANARGLVVALSGGLDSSCLLDAAVRAQRTAGLWPVRAVHVDHGLQSAAAEFRRACAALCERLGIPLRVCDAAVGHGGGVSLEAAARDARYAALAAELGPGECLLTAHHAEDQAETLLLQALRGAGLNGLAGMPACRTFAAGWQLRPLLGVPRRALHAYAAQAGIAGVRDPMNEDPRFDRAYLRSELWPVIERRWPAAGAALSRSARHVAEAQQLLDQLADADLALLRDGDALSVPRLRSLNAARRVNALRRWIAQSGAAAAPAARLAEGLRQALEAAPDHQPAVCWDAYALRRYRDRLFITAALPPRLSQPLEWRFGSQPVLELGQGLGRLRRIDRGGGLAAGRLPEPLVVRARCGGELLRPARDAASRSVQHLCQDHGVLPWMRDALPFVYAGGELVAIADIWLSAEWCAPAGASGAAICWEDAPAIV